jgi:hypothetical protein
MSVSQYKSRDVQQIIKSLEEAKKILRSPILKAIKDDADRNSDSSPIYKSLNFREKEQLICYPISQQVEKIEDLVNILKKLDFS